MRFLRSTTLPGEVRTGLSPAEEIRLEALKKQASAGPQVDEGCMQLVGQMALNGNFELELPLIGQRAQSDSSGHHRAIQEFGVRAPWNSLRSAFSGSSEEEMF